MVDWDDYLACDICPALQGEACFDLSAGGPEALPEIRREVPHSTRKPSARVAPKPATRLRTPQPATTDVPARRRAGRTASTAASWRAVAERQRRR